MISLTRQAIDYQALTEAVRDPQHGAVVLFLGTVRDRTGEQATARLEYEAYAAMAEREMRRVVEAAQQRWPQTRIALIHRLGTLEVGEVSVAVAVSAPHRAEAFAACRYVIDTLKATVPIWKKEIGPDGTGEWVHPADISMSDPFRPESAV
ncbi:MAG: molybdenum cofactor biosynthesis protein MoaE [Gemmataceae bacterium]|nr:molybdenum cofactor biosynthesis protein MoaE [Gemmataceae bacterium]MCS7270619.1 molybdenum cofactor biosynthesis protein MoaE [Gemmataceae bacterium]MDW8242809.1 molybdenum cofactor biosynthesis protein MoaE [Thermogemmata sp.]